MQPMLVDVPTSLAARGITLRQERDEDVEFLTELYASTRMEELAAVTHWSDADKQAFVAQQFAAQRHHYRNALADVEFGIVEASTMPIGRLYVQPRETTLQLIDITLRPDRRQAGLGTALIEAVIAAAVERGLYVGLFVERYSAALPLYRRLGFTTLVEHEVYLEMEHAAGRSQLKTAS